MFKATADEPEFANSDGNPQLIGDIAIAQSSVMVPWTFAGVTLNNPTDPSFIVVSPPNGLTPGETWIGLNPNVVPYLPAGAYGLLANFTSPNAGTAGVNVTLELSGQPPPAITSVVSAAAFEQPVSPGEIVSIFGANLGTPPVFGQFDSGGLFPKTLGNTTVTFNGIAVPLLYVSTTQINAIVPYEVTGQKTVDVVVAHCGQLGGKSYCVPSLNQSSTFTVPLIDTSPGIFTSSQNGSGQGAISQRCPDGTICYNSTTNPAPKGSVITFFATGSGPWNPPVPDGSILLSVLQPTHSPAATVSLTIGGRPASIQFAGASPFLITSMIQINAVIPDGIGSGPQPLVLTIGQNNNSQQYVSVAVQ